MHVGKTLVVIDDQSEVRDLVRMILKAESHELYEAANGEAGLQLIREHLPACVILDLRLPGALGGLDVCRRIRSDPGLSQIGIVIITSLDRRECLGECNESGADAVLSKPFSFVDLVTAVECASRQAMAGRG